jgi:GNAT superfamily N-acetyltransferase
LPIHINKDLAGRLETVESLNSVEYSEAMRRVRPDSEATSKKIGTGHAVFAGIDSPITQAFGIGFGGEVSDEEIDELEEFFKARGSAVNVEVCHLSDMSLTSKLMDRGYRAIEYSNVLIRPLGSAQLPDTAETEARPIETTEMDGVAVVIARGFLEQGEIPESFVDIFKVLSACSNVTCFVSFRDGSKAGGGSVAIRDSVGVLSGASTMPQFRKRGVQTELIQARLKYAAAMGCDLAMVTTAPGSNSQRNVEKQGFQVAYARTKYQRSW